MQVNGALSSFVFRAWASHNGAASKALERLSTGLKLNRAGDDSSGLGISERMKAQLRVLEQEQSNAADALSASEKTDGTLADMQALLGRMNELALKAADGNYSGDRTALDREYQELLRKSIGSGKARRGTTLHSSRTKQRMLLCLRRRQAPIRTP